MPNAAAQAKAVLELETRIARAQWTRTRTARSGQDLQQGHLERAGRARPRAITGRRTSTDTGISGKTDYVIVGEPSYFKAFGEMVGTEPLSSWKSYLRWHVVMEYSGYMPKAFVDANFEFFGTALRGTPENRPRWKRGIALIEASIGEGLGKVYVAKYFPPIHQGQHGEAGRQSARGLSPGCDIAGLDGA